ncbi:MAG: DUF721 domain-containing protein [Bacteroidales bacterium]|nr:DUF721 domain-containing protein [Bacteroidales bacterium]MDE5956576.1 DUF721 domain-containing protein [Bacteroidales bacterium]MDE6147872.1 DUF721 domain-containing protein [Bacteroidales bacterium]
MTMAYDVRTNRLRRKEAVGMDELVREFIKEMRLSSGVNRLRVAEAWNAVSGASRYTLGVNFDKGVMYCTISSSVVRNQLYFQRDSLVKSLNEHLGNDPLFVCEWDGPVVKSLILR